MKNYLIGSVVIVLLIASISFTLTKYCPLWKTSCCASKDCVSCVCPCASKNNVLRWVRDPNTGTQYYGWYEPDGAAFNYVATASRNHRMGNVQDNVVPAHRWVQVD